MAAREIRCSNCDIINRVPSYTVRKIPQCGRCGARLPEPTIRAALRYIYQRQLYAVLILTVPFIAYALVPALLDAAVTSFGCEAPGLPTHGVYARYSNAPLLTWLTLRAASGRNIFVKFEDATTGRPVAAFFMRNGAELQSRMPEGSFRLKVARGQTWCGERKLFGWDTDLWEADKVLTFDEREQHVLSLSSRPDGNLAGRSIRSGAF